jgi:hypothetical protein
MSFNEDSCLRNYLDLSTAHMPDNDPDWGEVRVAEHEWGFVAFIAPDLEGVPEWLKETFDFAIALKCGIINFDSDADIIERLPTWDW